MHNLHFRKQQQHSPPHLLAQLLLFFVIGFTLLQAVCTFSLLQDQTFLGSQGDNDNAVIAACYASSWHLR